MSAGARDGGGAKPTATKVWDILPSLSGTPDPERSRRLLLVLHAYIDDSGQTEPPVFVLAGFVARAERWAEFSDKWKAALQGPPRLDHFKMHEAFTLSDQFEGWTVEARDDRLRLLAGIIREHVMAAVMVTVRHDDYKSVLKGKLDAALDRPYFVLYFAIMWTLLRWEIENGINEPINFIFDEQMYDSDVVQASFSKRDRKSSGGATEEVRPAPHARKRQGCGRLASGGYARVARQAIPPHSVRRAKIDDGSGAVPRQNTERLLGLEQNGIRNLLARLTPIIQR